EGVVVEGARQPARRVGLVGHRAEVVVQEKGRAPLRDHRQGGGAVPDVQGVLAAGAGGQQRPPGVAGRVGHEGGLPAARGAADQVPLAVVAVLHLAAACPCAAQQVVRGEGKFGLSPGAVVGGQVAGGVVGAVVAVVAEQAAGPVVVTADRRGAGGGRLGAVAELVVAVGELAAARVGHADEPLHGVVLVRPRPLPLGGALADLADEPVGAVGVGELGQQVLVPADVGDGIEPAAGVVAPDAADAVGQGADDVAAAGLVGVLD